MTDETEQRINSVKRKRGACLATHVLRFDSHSIFSAKWIPLYIFVTYVKHFLNKLLCRYVSVIFELYYFDTCNYIYSYNLSKKFKSILN